MSPKDFSFGFGREVLREMMKKREKKRERDKGAAEEKPRDRISSPREGERQEMEAGYREEERGGRGRGRGRGRQRI